MKKMSSLLLALSLCITSWCNAQIAFPWVEVAGGQWSPPQELLSEINRNMLLEILQIQQSRGRKIAMMPSHTYTYQYQGQLGAGQFGQRLKIIHINALCSHDKTPANLSKRWIIIADGGSCYFNVDYDVDSRRFINVFINGVA